ncbi:MAG: sel1 repeat family protein [Amylibacter sp.]|nr:sel1 repeat family protein [Amylibacter sp.]
MNFIKSLFTTAISTLFIAPLTSADELPSSAQASRTYFNAQTDTACQGDQGAYLRLEQGAIREKNPAALNALAWLNLTAKCANKKYNAAQAIDLQRQAAELGYLIAQSNYALRLAKGLGIKRNPALAKQYFQRAIEGGYGTGALVFGEMLVAGEFYPKDLKSAARMYYFASQDDVNRDRLHELLMLIQDAGGTIPEPLFTKAWGEFQAQAYWDLVRDGKFKSRVFFGQSDHLGGFYFGMKRNSDDPLVHFIDANVINSDGTKTPLDIANCFGASCLNTYETNYCPYCCSIVVPIRSSAYSKTLSALKSGKDITFRYQSKNSAKKNKLFSNTLSLKGSYRAIKIVEDLFDEDNDQEPNNQAAQNTITSNAKPKTPSATKSVPQITDGQQMDGKNVIQYAQNSKGGDVLCTAPLADDYPTHFYAGLPERVRNFYLEDPTNTIKPVLSEYLQGPSTTVWTGFHGAARMRLILYKNGTSLAISVDGSTGIREWMRGAWVSSETGVAINMRSREPEHAFGHRNAKCTGGTLAKNRSSLGNGKPYRGCSMLMMCEHWMDNSDDIREPNPTLMSLHEWHNEIIEPAQMQWV